MNLYIESTRGKINATNLNVFHEDFIRMFI